MDEPFYLCDYRGGRLTMTLFGSFANAKPEDEIRYVETPAWRAYQERRKAAVEQHLHWGKQMQTAIAAESKD